MKYDIKEGFGKFTWGNGDCYEGNWRNNRFEGAGTFTHHTVIFFIYLKFFQGNVLKGIFKNNYFIKGNDLFVNPFYSEEEIEEFIKMKNEINLLKEKNKK